MGATNVMIYNIICFIILIMVISGTTRLDTGFGVSTTAIVAAMFDNINWLTANGTEFPNIVLATVFVLGLIFHFVDKRN